MFRRAGLLISDGTNFVRIQRSLNRGRAGDEYRIDGHHLFARANESRGGEWTVWREAPDPKLAAYLRFERRGDRFAVKTSHDGKKWVANMFRVGLSRLDTLAMPNRIKVGVMAESNAPGVFRPVFDHFELGKPGPEPVFDSIESILLAIDE